MNNTPISANTEPTDSPLARALALADAELDSNSPANAPPEPSAPEPSSAPAVAGFAAFDLMPELLKALDDLGFTAPTAVQQAVLGEPEAGQPALRDCMVSSQTGSGKTAAFLLPLLQALELERRENDRLESQAWSDKLKAAEAAGLPPPKKPKRKNPTSTRNFTATKPSALVLCPTRELAQQVANDAVKLVKYIKGVRVASIIGGLPYGVQIARLQNAMLVIATPGRLLDLQRSGQIVLEQLRFLVLDEADRMLDLGFAEELEAVNALSANREQTMMFSATFAPRVQSLAAQMMRQPERIQIDSPQERHNNITQTLYWADNPQHRRALLDHLLRDASIQQAIVFASTQVECDALAEDLQVAGFSAAALHGALSQGLRTRRLKMLREGRIQILVATDVAARGIDVASISHVFNYGLPMKAEDYVHRIGRTGRAGRQGLAITLAEPRDRFRIRDIEFYTKQTLSTATVPGMEPKALPQAKKGKSGFAGRPSGKARAQAGGRFSDRFKPQTERRSGGFDRGPRAQDGFDAPRYGTDTRATPAWDKKKPKAYRAADTGYERNKSEQPSLEDKKQRSHWDGKPWHDGPAKPKRSKNPAFGGSWAGAQQNFSRKPSKGSGAGKPRVRFGKAD